jgi:AAA15 family ATPase/GTPase
MNTTIKKTIGFSNFKAFGEEVQAFDRKPITLIYGPNSIGKSSLIHALAYLQYIKQTGKANLIETSAMGDKISLGGFNHFVHKHDSEREIIFEMYADDCTELIEESFKHRNAKYSVSGKHCIDVEVHIQNGFEKKLIYFIDKNWFIEVINNENHATIDFNDEHALFSILAGNSYSGDELTIEGNMQLSYSFSACVNDEDHYDVKILMPDLQHHVKAQTEFFLLRMLKFITLVNTSFFDENGLTYLGPLRFYPERVDTIKPINYADTLDDNDNLNSNNAWAFIGKKYAVGEKINKWLLEKSKFTVPYYIDHTVLGNEEYHDLVFVDMRNNTRLHPRDLGLGLSQVIPILAATNGLQNTTIAIEQPELHLHPAAQCELADEFIRSYREDGNKFILETHSEHILLRIMNRLRHTSRGNNKDVFLNLTPSDVCLLYIDLGDDNETIIRQIRLAKDGSLLDPWPIGFFDEGFKEMFS